MSWKGHTDCRRLAICGGRATASGRHCTKSDQSADEKKVEPRYFRILVNKPAREGKRAEAVNIRVPMTVVRRGLRLGSLFPGMLAKKKLQLANGNELDLSKVTYTDLGAMIKDIGELTVDVDGDAQVRIRCE